MAFSEIIMTEATEQIFDSDKRTVTLNRVTRSTSNITGSQEESYGSNESIDIIFYKKEEVYKYLKEALLTEGDCIMYDKPDNNNVSFHDKVTADGETYLVKKVITHRSRGEAKFDEIIGIRV